MFLGLFYPIELYVKRHLEFDDSKLVDLYHLLNRIDLEKVYHLQW